MGRGSGGGGGRIKVTQVSSRGLISYSKGNLTVDVYPNRASGTYTVQMRTTGPGARVVNRGSAGTRAEGKAAAQRILGGKP
jgi:hypothetical protein